jgi:hypothetical protein
VYHGREESERSSFQQVIETSVQTDPRRREVAAMPRTMADVMQAKGRKEGRKQGREEGAVKARQEVLLTQLRERFGDLPAAIDMKIRQTRDAGQLDTWLKRFVAAATLEDVGVA